MNWLIIPIEELKQFDANWETRRRSVDGTTAIIHEELYNELVPPVMTLDMDGETTEPSYPFPSMGEPEIDGMLNSAEWTNQEEGV